MTLSVVSPVYKAEQIVERLVREIQKWASTITEDFEIILVEDVGQDHSWERIQELCLRNHKVRGIRLSRNFGQHNAITAGLDAAAGEWIVVMDCDLQDRPDQLPKLWNKAMEGYDIVLARRHMRQDKFFKKATSRMFFRLFSFLTDTHQDPSIGTFGIYHRKVIQAVRSMGDYIRFFPVLVQWVGFSRTAIDVEHSSRHSGKSSYTFGKLLKLAFNVILSFSEKPLMIGLQTGLVISIGSFIYGIVTLARYLSGAIDVPGYTSIFISIGFLSGIIIAFIGLTGLYVGKIFEKVRNRPIYLVQDELNKHAGAERPAKDVERFEYTH